MATGIQGRFLWYQLNTPDANAAQAFYKPLIGWGTEVWPSEHGPYTMWMRGGEAIGGIMEMPEKLSSSSTPPHWLPYIGADDVDATYRRVLDLGGKSHVEPTDIPNVGRFAVVTDPQDGLFALYKPNEVPPVAQPKIGDISWHEFGAADFDKAWEFYQGLFGWEIIQDMDMGEMGPYRLYGRGEAMLGGMYRTTPEMPVVAWTLYASVPDVNGAVEKVKQLGGQVTMGPHEVPGGDLILTIIDPQGAFFALHEKRSEHASASDWKSPGTA
jgi:predicted enzyme related to lactoylglutathione lyase